jgi:hypothetical protein
LSGLIMTVIEVRKKRLEKRSKSISNAI